MAGASSPRLQSKATGQATRERFGILSRTLNSSSTVRWILPARIRCPSKNDIVFVGPTFIQLHEFLDSGQLVDVTAKLDFGTPITDVKVISADVKIIPVVDAILRQEKDQEQFNIRGKPVAETEPPQILVLLTHENELIYVYAQEDAVGDVSLVFAKRPFLRGAGLPDSQCRYIAVDPQYALDAALSFNLLTLHLLGLELWPSHPQRAMLEFSICAPWTKSNRRSSDGIH